MLQQIAVVGCFGLTAASGIFLAQVDAPGVGSFQSLWQAGALGVIVLILFGERHLRQKQESKKDELDRAERMKVEEERTRQHNELVAEMRVTNVQMNLLIRGDMITIMAMKTLDQQLQTVAAALKEDADRSKPK